MAERVMLRGWKEIAGYMAVSVRTVRRWTRSHGLPVRQGGHGHVVAMASELDAWEWDTEAKQKKKPSRRSK